MPVKTMLHLTPADRIEPIMRDGLLTGREPELTSDAVWTLDYYETNPVFLARPDAGFLEALREGPWSDHVAIEVDVSGLDLVADLASLADHGARHDEDGYLFWTPSRMPDSMRAFCDYDGAIEIEHLLDPGTDACKAAIALTGTAACIEDIPASRLDAQMPGPVGPVRG